MIGFLKQYSREGEIKWVPEQKQWVVSFKHYDAILAQVNKLVRNDEEIEHDPYNNPAPSNSLGLAT